MLNISADYNLQTKKRKI